MDLLTEEGFIILGGPIGEGDGENALLVVEAKEEAEVRARLADDPWPEELHATESIRPWTVLLRARRRTRRAQPASSGSSASNLSSDS